MMLDLPDLVRKYGMKIDGVLHVGARLGEEAQQYASVQAGRVWWVEANPGVIQKLRDNVQPLGHVVIQGLVYREDDVELDFHVTNHEGMSSSILPFGTHPTFSPDTVFVDTLKLRSVTIDTLVEWHDVKANFLVMDLQGAEKHALLGAAKFLPRVQYVFSEVNSAEVYLGCAKIHELDEILADFERVETYWVRDQGWGDALWVRRP